MKFRKGLIAAAAAVAVSTTGIVAVPAFAENNTSTVPTTNSAENKSPEQIEAEAKLLEQQNKQKELELKAKEEARKEAEEKRKQEERDAKKEREEREKQIRENGTTKEKLELSSRKAFYTNDQIDIAKIGAWIGLFTTILGALGTLFNFARNQLGIKF
ncbi:hypothetical protein [Corynebacterium aquatimens]|uniref:Acyl-CoA thioesterase n=1 Tax=Corynebacterium aquatimens TaxID=1190508 RepID=A0A931E0P7_9CORY|nr:hypothetical protein [Corynebacterium aquatimens]MBG6121717.1 acyl-CoA thioesterase [Corynebacterium aquatimens]WJY65744.1 hypothetical protein CAQUA_05180 [Corynebacterium aquatimens]